MAYITRIVIEQALHSLAKKAHSGGGSDHATEVAHVLLANSPRHARRFAFAMHGRVARGLDTGLIEHWARVVMRLNHLG